VFAESVLHPDARILPYAVPARVPAHPPAHALALRVAASLNSLKRQEWQPPIFVLEEAMEPQFAVEAILHRTLCVLAEVCYCSDKFDAVI
jgi:hypothetical protein